MQTFWKVNGNDELLLFFSGWAMDERPTMHVQCKEADLCVCFDYNDLETADWVRWNQYRSIQVVGWSTGVWAAEAVLGNLQLPISLATAINGTPTTVDDSTGIPSKIFQLTYENLTPQSMEKFLRRMAGGALPNSRFANIAPKRKLENQKTELRKILDVDFSAFQQSKIPWNKAIVGINDAVFPFAAQLAYWNGNKVPVLEMAIPHFPFFEIDYYNFFCISRIK